MRDPGYYALLHANGMRFNDMVELIREEAELDDVCPGCTEMQLDGESSEAAPGTL